jgi:hypothetical protein
MYDELGRAARNTMQASAEVTLDLFYEFEGEGPGRSQMSGTVDFEAGRCQLSGDGEQYILDGSDEYQVREGEWVVLRGRPGTQSTLNPAWLLTRLTDAVVSSDRVGEEIVGALDRERVDSTSIGLAPEWTPGYRATLKAGRIVGMALECVGDDGQVGTSTTFALTTATLAPISLPEHATLIADDTQTTEDGMESEWRDSGLWRMVDAIEDDPDTLQWLGFVLTQIRPTVSPGQAGAVLGRIIRLLHQHGQEIPDKLPSGGDLVTARRGPRRLRSVHADTTSHGSPR